jgi:hypothetical protein
LASSNPSLSAVDGKATVSPENLEVTMRQERV